MSNHRHRPLIHPEIGEGVLGQLLECRTISDDRLHRLTYTIGRDAAKFLDQRIQEQNVMCLWNARRELACYDDILTSSASVELSEVQKSEISFLRGVLHALMAVINVRGDHLTAKNLGEVVSTEVTGSAPIVHQT